MIRKVFNRINSRYDLLKSFKDSELVEQPKVEPIIDLLMSDLTSIKYQLREPDTYSTEDMKVNLSKYMNSYTELIKSTEDIKGEIGDDLVVRLLQDSIDEFRFYKELL